MVSAGRQGRMRVKKSREETMSKRPEAAGVGRRNFLKAATLAGAAATVATPLKAVAQGQARSPKNAKAPQGVPAAQKAAETQSLPAGAAHLVEQTSGSDYMVDAFKS